MKKLILLIGMTFLHAAASYGTLECRKCMEAHKKDGTKSPFSCRKLETMQNHLLLKHGIYLCCDCRQHFKDLESYRKHMFEVHKKRACLYCWRTFEKKEDYELHKDGQHIDHRYQCGICLQRFSTLERFLIHAIVRHKQYVCPDCMRTACNGRNRNDWKPYMKEARGFKEGNVCLEHMREKHGKFVCLQCNMRTFQTRENYDKHLKDGHKEEKFEAWCGHCGHPNMFRYKAERMLHELKHAFLLFFLKKTICGYECCVPFQKALSDDTRMEGKSSQEKRNPKIEAVRAFAIHVSDVHKRCLFCENSVTDQSRETLKKNLASLTYRQIAEDARMFVRLDENTLSKGEIPVIPCDMCESALQPNRKSRLFFASIKELPFGKGLNVRDYPFHHLEYDEQKAEKNALLSVIKEVPANEEESCFVPKKDEKDDVILGEEDEAEDVENDEEEEEEKEEEDKKEDEKDPEPKDGK